MGTLVLGRSAQTKLKLLRELDPAHAWSSPNDRFYCLRCSRVHIAREVRIVTVSPKAEPPRVQCPSRGCEGTPAAWAILSPRETVSTLRRDVTKISGPILTHNGSVALVQRPLARGRAPRNLAKRQNQRRTLTERMEHAFAQSLHRLAFDYRSLLGALQPGTRRPIFHPLA